MTDTINNQAPESAEMDAQELLGWLDERLSVTSALLELSYTACLQSVVLGKDATTPEAVAAMCADTLTDCVRRIREVLNAQG